MKRCLLPIVVLSSFFSWGQNSYRPLPETNATWIQADFLYSAYNGHEHATVTSVVHAGSDTLINGLSYCKFGSHAIADWIDNFGSQQNQTSGTDTIPYSNGYFRQDTVAKKVFLWNDAAQTDELLYDFGNLVVGQPYPATVTNVNYPYLLVMAVDSVQLMDGNYYKRWILGTGSADSAYVSVIEGVGGTNGFNAMIYPVFEQSSRLLCHKTNTQIYENWVTPFLPPRYSEDCSPTLSIQNENEAGQEVYPNPARSQISVRTDKVIRSAAIYNLYGQLLFRETYAAGEKQLSLDLNTLESGTYLLRLQLSDDSVTTKQFQVAN